MTEYTFEQLKRDIERGKTIDEKDLLKLFEEQEKTIQELKTELALKCKPLFSKRQLHEENQQLKQQNTRLKQTIQEAYNTERTSLGKSVLKQIIDNL